MPLPRHQPAVGGPDRLAPTLAERVAPTVNAPSAPHSGGSLAVEGPQPGTFPSGRSTARGRRQPGEGNTPSSPDERLRPVGLGSSAASRRAARPTRADLASLGPPRDFESTPGAWAAQSFDQLSEFESRGSEVDGAARKRFTELVQRPGH